MADCYACGPGSCYLSHFFYCTGDQGEYTSNGHCSTLRVRPEQSGMILEQVKISDGPIWIFYINQSGQSSHSINSGRTQRGVETLPPMIICLLQDTFLMKPLESNMVSSDGLLRRLPGTRPQSDVESRVLGQNNPKMGMSLVPPK